MKNNDLIWQEAKKHLLNDWPALSSEQLEETKGNKAALVELIQKKYVLTHDQALASVSEILPESEVTTKLPDTEIPRINQVNPTDSQGQKDSVKKNNDEGLPEYPNKLYEEDLPPDLKLEKIYVDDYLMDLVPNFIQNKFLDLNKINYAIDNKDLETIKKIGHNWKGVCSSYGFNKLAEIGKKFEILAQNTDYSGIKKIIDHLPTYLKNVQIIGISTASTGSSISPNENLKL